MKNRWKNWRYATFGSCGALSGATLAGSCNGACTACFGCVVMGGSLAVLAIAQRLWKNPKEDANGLAATDH